MMLDFHCIINLCQRWIKIDWIFYVHDRCTLLAYDVEFLICEETMSMMNVNDWIYYVNDGSTLSAYGVWILPHTKMKVILETENW